MDVKMSDEVKHSIIWALVVIVLAISIPWSISWHYTTTTRAAIEAGYIQSTLPGERGVHWVDGKPHGQAEHDQ